MQKIRIASPCSADWNRMSGDDRVRFCPECQLNVYNFSAMSPAEIDALVSSKTGRLCARFYQRPDGTMLTQNCPVGFRATFLRATRLASASLSAILALSHARPAQAQTQSSSPLVQIRPASPELTVEVADPTGAAIPKAKISVLDKKSQNVSEVLTNDEGRATILLTPTSSYTITISANGFTTQIVANMEAPFAKMLTVKLEIGAILMGEVVAVFPQIEESPAISENLKMPAPTTLPSIQPATVRGSALHRFFSKLRHIF